MSKMSSSKRRSARFGSSKGKPNPFESRGMDKFEKVYTELERMRESIAAREGVPASDVWFTRGNSTSGWIPVVIGKNRARNSLSPVVLVAPEQVRDKIEIQVPEQNPVKSGGSLSNSMRRVMKLIALFMMVAEICLAAVTGWITSLHRHREPGTTDTKRETEAMPLCYSSVPNSPRGCDAKEEPVQGSMSTPSSPTGDSQKYYFAPAEGACFTGADKLPLRDIRTNTAVQVKSTATGDRQRSPMRSTAATTHFTPERHNEHKDVTSVLMVVFVILSTLAAGGQRSAAVVTACLTWYFFLLFRTGG